MILGASGMVGRAVLRECVRDEGVSEVVCLGRKAAGLAGGKVREVVRGDLFDLTGLEEELSGFEACFFCLGVSAVGMSEAEYRRVTQELTVAVGRFLIARNPEMCFVYVSGQGTDSSEQGRAMWARVKGATENAVLRMGFRDAYAFRPGMIEAQHGEVSATAAYRRSYQLLGWALPMLRRVWPGMVVTTEEVGRAMLRVAREGWRGKVLESRDIAECGGGRG